MKTIYACPRGCPTQLSDFDGRDLWCPVENEAISAAEVMAGEGGL